MRRFGVGVECGQSLIRRRSWSRPWWRRLPFGVGGFAVGPVIVWWKP